VYIANFGTAHILLDPDLSYISEASQLSKTLQIISLLSHTTAGLKLYLIYMYRAFTFTRSLSTTSIHP